MIAMVIGRGIHVVGLGLAVGLLVALAFTRLMQGLLFGVSTADPFTYAAVAGLMAATALLAAYVPARRGTRVDPTVALRTE